MPKHESPSDPLVSTPSAELNPYWDFDPARLDRSVISDYPVASIDFFPVVHGPGKLPQHLYEELTSNKYDIVLLEGVGWDASSEAARSEVSHGRTRLASTPRDFDLEVLRALFDTHKGLAILDCELGSRTFKTSQRLVGPTLQQKFMAVQLDQAIKISESQATAIAEATLLRDQNALAVFSETVERAKTAMEVDAPPLLPRIAIVYGAAHLGMARALQKHFGDSIVTIDNTQWEDSALPYSQHASALLAMHKAIPKELAIKLYLEQLITTDASGAPINTDRHIYISTLLHSELDGLTRTELKQRLLFTLENRESEIKRLSPRLLL